MQIVTMPRLGVTMKSGTIVDWKKEVGEEVAIGEPLFEIENDKSTVEIESAYGGFLRGILVEIGEEVPCGTPIAVIAGLDEIIDLTQLNKPGEPEPEQGASEAASSVEEANQDKPVPKTISASPRVRKLAAELGIDLLTIQGTGPGGAIREEDLRAQGELPIKVQQKIKLNSVQKSMAKNLLESWRNTPHFVQMITVNAQSLRKVKEELGEVSINDIMVKAVANAVEGQLYVNSTLKDDEVIVYSQVNISVAMASKDGLIVPVVKDAQAKSVQDISTEIKGFSQKGALNQLTMEDMSHGTITVSSLGAFGVETGTPVINPPQGALVFVGAIKKIPMVNAQDEIVVGEVLELSIAFDHRYIDGVTAATFSTALKQEVENLTVDRLL